MDMVMVIIALALGLLIGTWANAWGRNPFGWGIAGFLLPLPVAIVLAVVGKSLGKRAEEAREIERMNRSSSVDGPWDVGQNFYHRP